MSLTSTKVKEVVDNGVVVEKDGSERFIPADTVVLAVGSHPDSPLATDLKKAAFDSVVIGDAVKAGLAGTAVMQGFLAGRDIN